MDYILIVHPAGQVLFQENAQTQQDIERFRELRTKLNQTRPF